MRALRFLRYDAAGDVPNVVVDGSPNPSTVLTLSHWPGMTSPAHVLDDLSAQMAFRYLDAGVDLHAPAEVVTNNHFDQDGLVGIFALARPHAAMPRRAVLEDVAAAGDFATFRFREAARASMAIAALARRDDLPDDHEERTSVLYEETLERLPELVDHPDRSRPLWEEEDAALSASERAVASGEVRIEEHPDVDLAVVTVPHGADGGGHRFAHRRFGPVHPMALHNATDRFVLLLAAGRRYELTHRYETWVQYRSRPTRPRADLAPLAAALSDADDVTWHADDVNDLTPSLRHEGESSLAPGAVVAAVRRHLAAT